MLGKLYFISDNFDYNQAPHKFYACTSLLDKYYEKKMCNYTYLHTYSMEQSASWEANWFCS